MGSIFPKSVILQGTNNFPDVTVNRTLFEDDGRAFLYASGKKNIFKRIGDTVGDYTKVVSKAAVTPIEFITNKEIVKTGKGTAKTKFGQKIFNLQNDVSKVTMPIAAAAAIAAGVGVGAKKLNEKKTPQTPLEAQPSLTGTAGIGGLGGTSIGDEAINGTSGMSMQDILAGELPGALAGAENLINPLIGGAKEESTTPPPEPPKKDNTMLYIFMAAGIFVGIMIFKK